MNDKLLMLIVGAVIFVFLGNFFLTAFDTSYHPDTSIGPIMGTIAGGAVAWMAARKHKKEDDND